MSTDREDRIKHNKERISTILGEVTKLDFDIAELTRERDKRKSMLNWYSDMLQQSAQLEFPFDKDEMKRKYAKKSYL